MRSRVRNAVLCFVQTMRNLEQASNRTEAGKHKETEDINLDQYIC